MIFGVIAAAFPGAGILAIISLLGAWLIVLGVLLIDLGLSLRQPGRVSQRREPTNSRPLPLS